MTVAASPWGQQPLPEENLYFHSPACFSRTDVAMFDVDSDDGTSDVAGTVETSG